MKRPAWFQRSLIVRLFVLALLVVLSAMVVRWLVLSQALRVHLTRAQHAQLEATAQLVAADIDSRVVQRRALLQRLAGELNPGQLGDAQALGQRLADRQNVAPLFTAGLAVLSRDGAQVLGASDAAAARVAPDLFRLLHATPDRPGADAFLVGSVQRLDAGRGRLPMAFPVTEVSGAVQAWVLGAVTLEPEPEPGGLLAPVEQHRVGVQGGFLLISARDRQFVGSSLPALRLAATPADGVNALHDRAMAGWRGTGITVNAQGGEELVAVTGIPSTGWFLVARLPTAEAFAPLAAVTRSVVQLGLPGTLLVLSAVFWVMWRQLRPLKDAAARIHRMASGDEPIAALPMGRPDEVGEMVAGFNALVQKLRLSEERLAHLAHHDALTGLPNRLALQERLQQELAIAERQGRQLALVFIDLDGFKDINDRLGHRAGDAVLCVVAQRLRAGVRRSDTVARLGGDEFVLLLTELAGPEAAEVIGSQVVQWLEAPLEGEGPITALSASVGVALYPHHGRDADALMARADAAMYRAKRAGRGRVCLAEALEARS